MTFPRPTSDTVAAIRAFLADPRFASASTLAVANSVAASSTLVLSTALSSTSSLSSSTNALAQVRVTSGG